MVWLPLLQITTLDPTTRWLLVGAVVLTIFYAVMRPLKKKKDPLHKLSAPSLSQQRSAERDMSQLLVELSNMARQLTAQLDTRSMKLELLIKEADERIESLTKAAAAAPNPPSAAAANAAAPVPQIDPRHVEVYELADQKLSPQQIAQQLSRPRGEVELILALRHRAE